jgi:hypothetical protein
MNGGRDDVHIARSVYTIRTEASALTECIGCKRLKQLYVQFGSILTKNLDLKHDESEKLGIKVFPITGRAGL